MSLNFDPLSFLHRKYVKNQKSVREQIARMSSKPMYKVLEEVGGLRKLLAQVSHGLQRNASAIEKLKQESAQVRMGFDGNECAALACSGEAFITVFGMIVNKFCTWNGISLVLHNLYHMRNNFETLWNKRFWSCSGSLNKVAGFLSKSCC